MQKGDSCYSFFAAQKVDRACLPQWTHPLWLAQITCDFGSRKPKKWGAIPKSASPFVPQLGTAGDCHTRYRIGIAAVYSHCHCELSLHPRVHVDVRSWLVCLLSCTATALLSTA